MVVSKLIPLLASAYAIEPAYLFQNDPNDRASADDRNSVMNVREGGAESDSQFARSGNNWMTDLSTADGPVMSMFEASKEWWNANCAPYDGVRFMIAKEDADGNEQNCPAGTVASPWYNAAKDWNRKECCCKIPYYFMDNERKCSHKDGDNAIYTMTQAGQFSTLEVVSFDADEGVDPGMDGDFRNNTQIYCCVRTFHDCIARKYIKGDNWDSSLKTAQKVRDSCKAHNNPLACKGGKCRTYRTGGRYDEVLGHDVEQIETLDYDMKYRLDVFGGWFPDGSNYFCCLGLYNVADGYTTYQLRMSDKLNQRDGQQINTLSGPTKRQYDAYKEANPSVDDSHMSDTGSGHEDFEGPAGDTTSMFVVAQASDPLPADVDFAWTADPAAHNIHNQIIAANPDNN